MSNNAPDYENDLAFSPKSADDLNKQGRESDVLVSALEKCEKLEQEVKQLKGLLKECQEIIEWYKADCGYKDLPTESVLTKIDEVLK